MISLRFPGSAAVAVAVAVVIAPMTTSGGFTTAQTSVSESVVQHTQAVSDAGSRETFSTPQAQAAPVQQPRAVDTPEPPHGPPRQAAGWRAGETPFKTVTGRRPLAERRPRAAPRVPSWLGPAGIVASPFVGAALTSALVAWISPRYTLAVFPLALGTGGLLINTVKGLRARARAL